MVHIDIAAVVFRPDSVMPPGVGGPDASDQWKRPERACAPVYAAQVLAGRRAFAEQQPAAVDLYQVELFPARRDRHDP